MKMDILVACEESGVVRDAFIQQGHNALSCDLLPTSSPGPHYRGDVFNIINDGWDLMIAHPPCTFLSVSGAQWFYHPDDKHLPTEKRRRHPKYPNRHENRADAIDFFMRLAEADIPRIAIENPVCVMSSHWRKPDQIIQPYEYGDPFKKTTCLWLKGLPALTPTNVVKPEIVTYGDGSRFSADYGFHKGGGARSKTYQGIANAMAQQWGLSWL